MQRVHYAPKRIDYRTFDATSHEILRLGWRPARVEAGGQSYRVRAIGDGDFVVRISHRGHGVSIVG